MLIFCRHPNEWKHLITYTDLVFNQMSIWHSPHPIDQNRRQKMRCISSYGMSQKRESVQDKFISFKRNNLTILESILLRGEGGSGSLTVGNRKAGSSDIPLVLEMNEKQYKLCSSMKERSFTESTLEYISYRLSINGWGTWKSSITKGYYLAKYWKYESDYSWCLLRSIEMFWTRFFSGYVLGYWNWTQWSIRSSYSVNHRKDNVLVQLLFVFEFSLVFNRIIHWRK